MTFPIVLIMASCITVWIMDSEDYVDSTYQRLVDAIAQGYRGAYWDILRRYK